MFAGQKGGAYETPQGIETVRSKFHQLMKCFWAGVLSRRFLKKATAAPAKTPGNWEKTHSLALGTRETQHRHGYKQSLSQSLSGISLFVGAFPKGQHLSALPTLPVVTSLNHPSLQLKSKRAPLHSTHAWDPWWHSSGMPPSTTCWRDDLFTLPEIPYIHKSRYGTLLACS